ncbi:ankyrin repeat domain-containing protein [Endozoicomonas sp. YOMI1]|uniref:ankyrin repeat domain-containing protein n=1 Tax=Endozoicomonas sp. YOMI1 TaxID=2828739 RepID=UPI0021478BDF|nr:ankyrin repeat domain-containing protein [Endozoicomonas sp. YOMI1]
METTSQPFSTLCCCTNFRYCPNPPGYPEENECRSAGYRKIQITESVNNLSVSELVSKRVSKRVSKYSLDLTPEEKKHHHVPHIRVRSNLHDEDILRHHTREVQQLQRFHEVINWNTKNWSTRPEKQREEIEQLLKVHRSSYWMKMAIEYGYLDVLKYFINKGEEINKVGSSSHICKAVSYGQLEIVEYLVDLGLKDEDKSFFIPDDGRTANEGLIHEAVGSSNKDEDTAYRMIELLLSKGEDPDGCCGEITPLRQAVKLNKLRIAKLLRQRSNLKRYCLLSVSDKKEFDWLTTLQNAIEGKDESGIKSLRKKSGLDSAKWMQMASRHGFLEVLNYFVGQGKKVCNKSFQAPIWSAVSRGQFEIVEYLIDPKLNDRKKAYYKPVHKSGIDSLIDAAVQSTWMDEQTACRMIRLLLDSGEPIDGHGKYSPLVRAEALNKTVIVNFLKKEAGLYIQQSEEKVCDDMPAPLGPHDDYAEPEGAYGYSPIPSAPPADPVGAYGYSPIPSAPPADPVGDYGYFPIPSAPPAYPVGDYGYFPIPSAPPADPEGDGYFPIPLAPPAYDSSEYRLNPPGTLNVDTPPSYEESMGIEKNPK